MSDEYVNQNQKRIYQKIVDLQKQIEIFEEPTQTAKNVRKILKIEFPSVEFSIRTAKYAGGASVTIRPKRALTTHEMLKYKKLANKFNSFEGDLMDGFYNVGYMFEGKRRAGAHIKFETHDLISI